MKSEKQCRGWVGQAAKMREELTDWYRAHPRATLDEIVAWITPRRRELMGRLVEEVIQAENGVAELGATCSECGQVVQRRACQERDVIHFEGDTRLRRDYYYCPRCRRGFFPPGSTA